LKGAALEWCRSLPAASIRSLAGFHTAFNSFCKDYYPAVHLFESCCKEFSSLHEASVGPEDHVHDKAFTVEESIFHEKIEVLNDINCVGSRTEASDIISDASIPLEVHNDQHASGGSCELIEQMWSVVDDSLGYRVEADIPSNPVSEDGDLPVCKEVALSELMISLIAQHARLKSEDNGEDFPVSKVDVLDGSLEENIEDLLSALTSVPDELVVSEQNDEVVVVEEDCSLFLHEISHDVFTFGIEKEDPEIVPFLQDQGAWCSPSFNDYSVEEQQGPTSQIDDLGSSQPVYDNYESGSELDTQNFQEKTAEPSPLFTNERPCEEISPPE
jgi:hypothetical protein